MTIERRKTVRDFAIARFTRLMPAFLAALVLASVILIFWPMPPLDTPTLVQFIANLTMAPGLFGQDVVDLPYWTLTYELVFYVFMALALRLRLLGSIEWLGLFAMAVACIYRATVDIEHHYRTTIVLLAYYSNFFLIGICLYRIQTARARPITYVALALAIAMSGLGGGEQAFRASGWLYLALTAVFTGLVWLATTRHARWIASPLLVFLGQISYPLYLVHVALGYQVIRFGVEQEHVAWRSLGRDRVAGGGSRAALPRRGARRALVALNSHQAAGGGNLRRCRDAAPIRANTRRACRHRRGRGRRSRAHRAAPKRSRAGSCRDRGNRCSSG
jgi:peptidoglycan/LPS O-acetylase OafA/YrhL